ncbi:thermonuclease family protein [Franzmannia qiaohouensis]|uniref:Thermonuclease family protein n=1 Tax=Franzmannia qiaohouensis TaxID=1329370 RepID=A0ABU1HKQ7_9GAMM|nr:thermonuclease family protein [Halomonas qiaohouensis]MDR5907872.1 thermonuclease family protein [Halomonas qiaohouensis]
MKFIGLAVALLLAAHAPTAATEHEGSVTQGVASVIDGDTLEIHNSRIRLHGIDAPESGQVCIEGDGSAWRCGQAAALDLAEKISRTPILCEHLDVDRYGRIIARCFGGREDLNKWMVNEGLAVAYRQYSSDYVSDETQARDARKGIWRTKFDMPWDWRKGSRTSESSSETPKILQRLVQRSYSCSPRRTCSQIGSCQEARWYLANCSWGGRLDRDNDSIPCESIC